MGVLISPEKIPQKSQQVLFDNHEIQTVHRWFRLHANGPWTLEFGTHCELTFTYALVRQWTEAPHLHTRGIAGIRSSQLTK